MSTAPDNFAALRVTRAYIRLLCIPESEPGPRIVSLGRVGIYEIRMFEASQANSSLHPKIWMELFDHDRQMCVDSCICVGITEAVAAYERFISGR
jgi:hypothetical protein